jgi:hypothetical protein
MKPDRALKYRITSHLAVESRSFKGDFWKTPNDHIVAALLTNNWAERSFTVGPGFPLLRPAKYLDEDRSQYDETSG